VGGAAAHTLQNKTTTKMKMRRKMKRKCVLYTALHCTQVHEHLQDHAGHPNHHQYNLVLSESATHCARYIALCHENPSNALVLAAWWGDAGDQLFRNGRTPSTHAETKKQNQRAQSQTVPSFIRTQAQRVCAQINTMRQITHLLQSSLRSFSNFGTSSITLTPATLPTKWKKNP
jgi:hypothetical protein